MTLAESFAPDYFVARDRFRETAVRLGAQLESHPISARGQHGEELTIDLLLTSGPPERVLVVTSGIHGVEGQFGSAVQAALMKRWLANGLPPVRCLLLHGLNPFGFAYGRRVDDANIDLNRNFLLNDEPYQGAPAGYAELDPLLNPRRPPSRWEPFLAKALTTIARHGMPALRQAVAGGQYEFSKGLFFGGAGPSEVHGMLERLLPGWFAGSRQVGHLDLHTGLGARGAVKLLPDARVTRRQRDWLQCSFAAETIEFPEAGQRIAYDTRGGLGHWCAAQLPGIDYHFAVAEFGTSGALRVLSALREENQAHHWGSAGARVRARQKLQEVFCPSDPVWRDRVVRRGLLLIEQTVQGLLGSANAT